MRRALIVSRVLTLRRNFSFSNGVTFSGSIAVSDGDWDPTLALLVNGAGGSQSSIQFAIAWSVPSDRSSSKSALNCRQTASLSAVLQSMNADFCLAYPFARVRALKTVIEHKRARDRERL